MDSTLEIMNILSHLNTSQISPVPTYPNYLPPGQQKPARMKRNLIQWKDNGAPTKPIGKYYPIRPTYTLLTLLNLLYTDIRGACRAGCGWECIGGVSTPLHSEPAAWATRAPGIFLANFLSGPARQEIGGVPTPLVHHIHWVQMKNYFNRIHA